MMMQSRNLLTVILIFLVAVISYYDSSVQGAALLPDSEVEGLKEVAKSLGKTDWNFSVDPCSGESGWTTPNPVRGSENAVICNCTYDNNTVCHVVSIQLKSQNLPGILPQELVKLPYLQQLELTRNYLNGSIPKQWGSLPLVNLSLVGNRISGSIPVEFTNITTLKDFTLDFNQVSGPLPPELGNMINLERLLLSSNNFTGPLPETLAKLTNLNDFRISDNHFTGKIPNFIQNWTNLEKIAMQASGLQGPIPLGISLLTKITDMRISDLNGTANPFPPLSTMKDMKTLVLRSCNIIGEIPPYLGDMGKLKTLDLSFNKLTGTIPSSFDNLVDGDFMYLTGNVLTGPVPEWMLKSGDNVDLSYNNFTFDSSDTVNCQQRNVNLFGLPSGESNLTGIVPCLKSYSCPRGFYSFHINCGGRQVTTSAGIYEGDSDTAGASKFYQGSSNWVSSNTGNFMDDNNDADTYIAANSSRLAMNNSQLYMTGRLSPLSLTYYGFCLLYGNYTVNLHFAEIVFTNGKEYSSLGRRIFDVYIQVFLAHCHLYRLTCKTQVLYMKILQGKLVLKDFNIEDAAGGIGKEFIAKFPAVVTDGTLEIRFYWAGKGTTGIPSRGVYGPLVSAISVNPDFDPPQEDGKKISAGLVVGIVLSGLIVILMSLGILWWKGCILQRTEIDGELRGLDLLTGSFTLRQIRAATNNFDPGNKIGEGGFGSVYKGHLSDGTVIAVKQLSSKSKQGNREFVNEIGMISALQHPHLVKLYGCCIEGNQLLLVYEYLENNCLARALFGPEEYLLKLDWPTRQKICIGVARALAYLHEESRLKIVHRDIKATNILLDKDLNAKVSDFGLAKLDDEENTHISTRIAGTLGYMAPEYALRGYLTDKADVYSFGIVALEIASGRSNSNYRSKQDGVYLLDWALVLQEKGKLMDLVDPRLESNYVEEEVLGMINIAFFCTNASPTLRPTMSSVVSMLEGRTTLQKSISGSGTSIDDTKFKAIRDHYEQSPDQSMSNSQTQSMVDGPWAGSSTSGSDLYPLNPNSQYWREREN